MGSAAVAVFFEMQCSSSRLPICLLVMHDGYLHLDDDNNAGCCCVRLFAFYLDRDELY